MQTNARSHLEKRFWGLLRGFWTCPESFSKSNRKASSWFVKCLIESSIWVRGTRNALVRDWPKKSRDRKAVTKGIRLLCRKRLLVASLTEYAENAPAERLLAFRRDTYQVRQGGFLPSSEPWNKSRRYRTNPLEAAHENELRLAVPSCHGRR